MSNIENLQLILNKRIKEDKVITQKELANILCVSPVAVNKWLNGGSIDSNKIPALCTALNITPNELFGFTENLEDYELLNILHSNLDLKAYVLSTKKKD